MTKRASATLKRLQEVAANPATYIALLIFGYAFFIPFFWAKVNTLQNQVAVLGSQIPATASNTSFSSATATLPPVTASDHILGNANAKVVIVEYADLECPFCKEFAPILQEAKDVFGTQIALVYRTYPLSFHQNAEKEAEAQECVAAQGGNAAFWTYTDAIFQETTSNGLGFALNALEPLAAEQGLNRDTFTACLNAGTYAQKVAATESAGTAAGVTGTPSSFILKNGSVIGTIPGAVTFDQIKQMIQSALS